MPREILIHLNVEVPADDERTTLEIAHAVFFSALDLTRDDSVRDLTVEMPLYEEV